MEKLKSIKSLMPFVKPHVRIGLIGFLILQIYTILINVAPIISKQLVEDLITRISLQKLMKQLIMFSLVWLLQPVTSYLSSLMIIRFKERIVQELRNEFFKKVLYSPITVFEKSPPGTILTRILNETEEIGEFIQDLINNFTKNIIIIIFSFSIMLWLSPFLTVVLAMILFLFAVFILKKGHQIGILQKESQLLIDRMNTFVPSVIRNIVSINLNNAQNFIFNKFNEINSKLRDLSVQIFAKIMLLSTYTALFAIVAIIIIYVGGSIVIINGHSTVGMIVALSMYFQNLIAASSELFDSGIEFRRLFPLIERLNEFLLNNTNNIKIENTSEMLHFGELDFKIVIEDLWFKYENSDSYVLQGINLIIEPNSIIGIIGESGCGKSTFLKLLCGLYKPERGSITICGKNISKIDFREFWRYVSYIPQEAELIYNLSIRENIKLSNLNKVDNDIENICEILKINKKIIKLPYGYDTMYDEKINFSGGEKQRILLARELLKEAKILLFDEPTSSLDEENERILCEILKELKENRIIIIVSHRKKILEYADKIFTLNNGRLFEMNFTF